MFWDIYQLVLEYNNFVLKLEGHQFLKQLSRLVQATKCNQLGCSVYNFLELGHL